MIRTVIFDIDNTLYDFVSANQLAVDRLASYAEENFGWTKEQFKAEYKWVQDEMLHIAGYYSGGVRNRIIRMQLILEKNGLPLHPHAIIMYDLYWKTLLDSMQISDGAEETLQELKKRGIRIGVGTDMTAYMQFQKLSRLALLPYIDFLVTSEEAGEEKPSRRFFARCLDKIMCEPCECLFVGDHPVKDCQGALDAGMQALWFNPKKQEGNETLRQINDLRQILLNV